MKKTILILVFILNSKLVLAIDREDTRMLHQPAIGIEKIAFIYAEDLWTANLDGSNPIRLTIDEGIESNPHFSPDGKNIAFSASYDGNIDVFVVPTTGGIPKRLTYHPGGDLVRGFTPDGEVLFISQRTMHTRRYAQFFKVSTDGGFPQKLIIPHGNRGSYSLDGSSFVYNPVREVFDQWKGYRGGTMSRLWIFSFNDHSVIEIPKPTGGSNDTHPLWLGNQIYFTSDREGEFNIFSYNVDSKMVNQLTDHQDFPVLWISGLQNKIIYEQAGYLHLLNLENNTSQRLKIGISTDLQELRPRFVSGAKYIRSAHISPSGSRAVFDYRGDIITVPEEKGDPRNITTSPGAHEKYPAWSPDGKQIAYFSDESGEYELHIQPQDGKSAPRKYPLDGAGFYAFPHWSPNGKYIAFVDNSRSLYLLTVASGNLQKINQDELYVPGVFRELFGEWSADSRWLVYNKIIDTNFKRIMLYNVETAESHLITDGMSDASFPTFDPTGKYLCFLASTDAGPVVNWFDQSNQDMEMSSSIYLVTLQKAEQSPFKRKSDEETLEYDETDIEKKDKEVSDITIDLEGIDQRIVDVPYKAGHYRSLKFSKEGTLYFVDEETEELFAYNFEKQKAESLHKANDFIISANHKKMLYRQDGNWLIRPIDAKPAESKKLNLSAVQLKIFPEQEWPNIFHEAWRINRDYFYDPGMHGADWEQIKSKYEVMLKDLSCRNDLNRLLQWMHSELRVGHHRIYNDGDFLNEPNSIPVGLLGADIEIANNRYRLKKIYGGLNWNPDLTSPLTKPGINTEAGDYILAVDGVELTADTNFYSLFEYKAGKIVTLTISANSDGSDSREVSVTPIKDESDLRNRDWVEGNLQKVHEATNGKVAYVYVPNTAGAGHTYFKRYFFPQANKDAIIVDERYNGGGLIADYYIELLTKPYQSYWNLRYGNDLKTPSASIQGPKVLIADENAGSGGDMFPWMWRKFEVGPIIGKTTWGGLVGILGFPEFIDGGAITAPNLAIWTKDGFIVENEGVPPDIEVEQWPKELIKGRDPQLEKAIEVVMQQLQENPPVKPERPPYPDKINK